MDVHKHNYNNNDKEDDDKDGDISSKEWHIFMVTFKKINLE